MKRPARRSVAQVGGHAGVVAGRACCGPSRSSTALPLLRKRSLLKRPARRSVTQVGGHAGVVAGSGVLRPVALVNGSPAKW
ncbi:hypothetical protein AB0M20_43290 [Actinoplanes sp. NPDC051633]|uniref:hypothetical protein n=1 Tax=Actinoplanes sp. NPDC051633 TaxID=3155670 RepID=UPI00342FCD74